MKINGLVKFVKVLKPGTSCVQNSVTKKVVPEKDLFCQQFWKKCKDESLLPRCNKSSVSLHGHLNGINHNFIRSPYPESLDEVFYDGMTPRDMIFLTDLEFKALKPTAQKITAFRCIGKKPEFFSEYPLYLKRTQIKKGDIIDMKEYAYATSDINYARGYLGNNKGILYEIEIPEGSRVSLVGRGINNEIVFPRSSQFKCTDVKQVKDAINDYIHVKLSYILPKELW